MGRAANNKSREMENFAEFFNMIFGDSQNNSLFTTRDRLEHSRVRITRRPVFCFFQACLPLL